MDPPVEISLKLRYSLFLGLYKLMIGTIILHVLHAATGINLKKWI